MKVPVSLRPQRSGPGFRVNEDPARLDRVLDNVLGEGSSALLTDEVKWLAVTHKSFDQGRRGYNDRLAYFGKRIVDLQASLLIIAQSSPIPEAPADEFGRQPFQDPALAGLSNLTAEAKPDIVSKETMASLAQRYGIFEVVRWTPKLPHDLEESGKAIVLSHALYALIGAISLQNGGEVANRIARERILAPLGLK